MVLVKEKAQRINWPLVMAVVLGLIVLFGYATYRSVFNPVDLRRPVGWSTGWTCVGASMKGSTYCYKGPLPAEKGKPAR